MNIVPLGTLGVQTMSSLELVDIINSSRKDGEAVLSHADFLKKVPKVLGEGGIGNFSDTYIHPQNGQKYPCYRFPKREACLMAMSYSYELQAKVYDRMTELEAQASQPILALPNFTDPAEAAIAWAAEFKAKQLAQVQVVQLETKVEELQPKANALDSLANATGLKTITQAAKVLGVQPEKFLRPWMLKNGWLHTGADGQYHAYADRIKAGHLKEKDRVITHKSGTQEVKVTVYVTPKGEALLAQRLADGTGDAA